MVEFVSANPTGPLHVGHGRQAALGDAVSTMLEWQGWRVTREFYYNDAGNQIANLALSVQARVKQDRGEAVEMTPSAPQLRAVVGGTGSYMGARGQVATTHDADGTYRHEFTLLDD